MRGELKIPEALYEARKQRMKRLIDLNAPKIIIWYEARTLLNSFKPSTWRERWFDWQMHKAPHWLLMLISADYRQATRDMKDSEKPCVGCTVGTDQICENCEHPLCYDCDACKYHDVLVCKDEAACSRRIDEEKNGTVQTPSAE